MIPKQIQALVEAPYICARVITQDRDSFMLRTVQNELRAELSGKFRFESQLTTDFPVVGDYVKISQSGTTGLIHELLPRKNLMARRAVDESHDMQGIAANIDRMFVVMSANRDFNLRRLERYLVASLAYEIPIAVILSKVDLCEDKETLVASLADAINRVPVFCISMFDKNSLEQLNSFRGPEQTLSFVGSSGVGKSTLINSLLGDELLDVSSVRENDQRGRHTTTRRCLFQLNDGTSVIDTPGMRELALADVEAGVKHAFSEIAELASSCRFRDCKHVSEPGCAVKESIDGSRLQSWFKLEREAAFQARSADRLLANKEKQRWKSIHKANRKRQKGEF